MLYSIIIIKFNAIKNKISMIKNFNKIIKTLSIKKKRKKKKNKKIITNKTKLKYKIILIKILKITTPLQILKTY